MRNEGEKGGGRRKDVRENAGERGCRIERNEIGECGRLSFAFETTVKRRELCAASLGVRACVRACVRVSVSENV